MTGAPLQDHLRCRHHVGIDLTASPSNCADLTSWAERDERYTGAARLDQNHAFATAEGQAPEARNTGLGHSGGDDAVCLGGHGAVRVDVLAGVVIERIDLGPRHEGRKVDDFRAL